MKQRLLPPQKLCKKKLCRVIYVNEERIWTCGKTNKIRCFNIKGILRKLFFDQFSNDIVVSINGDLIYSSGRTGTVNTVRNDKTEELINLPKDWTPSQLCITYSGDLLVTMFNDANQSKATQDLQRSKQFNMMTKVNRYTRETLKLNTSQKTETMTSVSLTVGLVQQLLLIRQENSDGDTPEISQ